MTNNEQNNRMITLECNMRVPGFCITENNIVRTQILRRLWEFSQNRQVQLLDVGCGTGWMWRDFLQSVPHVTFYGFDPNRNSVAKAQQALKRFADNIYCADIRQMPSLFPHKFDVIVSHSVLEHVYLRKEFFANICRSLKKDGLLLLSYGSDHFRQSCKIDVRNLFSRLLAAVGIEKYYAKEVDENEVVDLLHRHHMKIIKRRYYSLVPVKKAGKTIEGTESRKRFCLLWHVLEENLNQSLADQSVLQPKMDETYLEVVHVS